MLRIFKKVSIILFFSLLLFKCKTFQEPSKLATNADVSKALNLSKLPLPQKAVICSQNIMLTFYGLGEVMGYFTSSDPKLSQRVAAANREHKRVAKLYFEKVKEQARLLREAVTQFEKSCFAKDVLLEMNKFKRKAGKLFFVEVLDGPEVGDSSIRTVAFRPEASRYIPESTGTWMPVASGYAPTTKQILEISMPRHVNRIARFFIQHASKVFRAPIDHTIYFLKGHGTRIYKSPAYPKNREEMRFISNNPKTQLDAHSAFFFDLNGDSGRSHYSLFRPIWSARGSQSLSIQETISQDVHDPLDDQDVHDPLDDQDVHDPLDDQDVHDPLDDQSIIGSDLWGDLDQSVKKSLVFPYRGKSISTYINPHSYVFRGSNSALELGTGISAFDINIRGIETLKLPRGANSPSLIVFDTCFGINNIEEINNLNTSIGLDYSDIALDLNEKDKIFQFSARSNGVFIFNPNPLKTKIIEYGSLSPLQWSALALGLFETRYVEAFRETRFPYPTAQIQVDRSGRQNILDEFSIRRALRSEEEGELGKKKRLFVLHSQCAEKAKYDPDSNFMMFVDDYDFRYHREFSINSSFTHTFFKETPKLICNTRFDTPGVPTVIKEDNIRTLTANLEDLKRKNTLSRVDIVQSCEVLIGILKYKEAYVRRTFVTDNYESLYSSCIKSTRSDFKRLRSFPLNLAKISHNIFIANFSNVPVQNLTFNTQVAIERTMAQIYAVALLGEWERALEKLKIGVNYQEMNFLQVEQNDHLRLIKNHVRDYMFLLPVKDKPVRDSKLEMNGIAIELLQQKFNKCLVKTSSCFSKFYQVAKSHQNKLLMWLTEDRMHNYDDIPDVQSEIQILKTIEP